MVSGQMGNRVKSNDNLASRPGSVHNPGAGEEDQEGESPPPREPTPVPSQTIYMQAIDFLLEVKALPVSFPPISGYWSIGMEGTWDFYLSLILNHVISCLFFEYK